MLLKCVRLKRIYVKCFFLVLTVTFLVMFYLKSTRNERADVEVVVGKKTKLISNLSSVYEKTLREYESKIIPNLGDNGEAAFLDGSDALKGEEALKTFALNTVLSDRMPLDRKLRDPRHKK